MTRRTSTHHVRIASKRHHAIVTFALALASAAGCIASGDPGQVEDVESTTEAIQGGVIETGYPGVGLINFDEPDGTHGCTGTLISQSWVLTAAHCFGTNLKFKLGNNPNEFVTYTTDQWIRHPLQDLLLVHLTNPIEGIEIKRINEGAPPAVNNECTVVGFGWHNEPDGTLSPGDVKRSATVKVRFTGAQTITATMVTGITDRGDSGGPMFCGETIAAASSNHSDGEWPAHKESTFATVQASWILNTIAPAFTELTLQNGWAHAPYETRNAAVGLVGDKVTFRGAMWLPTGTNAVAFTLPAAYRPEADVYVHVDQCSNTKGSLFIKASTGVVTVRAETSFSDATCFTSLEGVSFAKGSLGYSVPSLSGTGWTNSPSGTGFVGSQNIGGIIHLRGAVSTTGNNSNIFTLPVEHRPAKLVYVPITLKDSKKGRLIIEPSGLVSVSAESSWTAAQGMTSLEGVTFAKDGTQWLPLSPGNGWMNYASTTAPPAVTVIAGVVRFRGAIKTTGTNAQPFTLLSQYCPPSNVYVPIDLCSGHKGRLLITPNGAVSVQANSWADAQCFTSLDGVSYPQANFTPLTLESQWRNGSTGAGFTHNEGSIQFKGFVWSYGTNVPPFRLPAGFRPPVTMYLPVSMCDARKGRLQIGTDGVAWLSPIGGPNTWATCRTSLEGVSFALDTTPYTALTLTPGWTHGPFGGRTAAAIDTGGTIRLAGAVATSGTDQSPFTLPAAFRPSADIYVPVDLVNGGKGRLYIATSGRTTVYEEFGGFAAAKQFTSLEGVTFPKNADGYTSLTLKNGWGDTIFGTRHASAKYASGIIRLQGAISGGTTPSTPAFQLPVGYRPFATTYVTVDLCGAGKGVLKIFTNGDSHVLDANSPGSYGNATCFTSLEGVTFAQR